MTIKAITTLSKDWWTGRILVRYDAQYTWVALGFDNGAVVVLSVEEVSVGKWFEVFPLKAETSLPGHLSNHTFEWVELLAPLPVYGARSL